MLCHLCFLPEEKSQQNYSQATNWHSVSCFRISHLLKLLERATSKSQDWSYGDEKEYFRNFFMLYDDLILTSYVCVCGRNRPLFFFHHNNRPSNQRLQLLRIIGRCRPWQVDKEVHNIQRKASVTCDTPLHFTCSKLCSGSWRTQWRQEGSDTVDTFSCSEWIIKLYVPTTSKKSHIAEKRVGGLPHCSALYLMWVAFSSW
jgi:hypothetical protein